MGAELSDSDLQKAGLSAGFYCNVLFLNFRFDDQRPTAPLAANCRVESEGFDKKRPLCLPITANQPPVGGADFAQAAKEGAAVIIGSFIIPTPGDHPTDDNDDPLFVAASVALSVHNVDVSQTPRV